MAEPCPGRLAPGGPHTCTPPHTPGSHTHSNTYSRSQTHTQTHTALITHRRTAEAQIQVRNSLPKVLRNLLQQGE